MTRFKVTNKFWADLYASAKAEYRYLQCDDNGKASYDIQIAKFLCRATGLRSKKTRHIHKRFKLIVNQALKDYVEEQDGKTI